MFDYFGNFFVGDFVVGEVIVGTIVVWGGYHPEVVIGAIHMNLQFLKLSNLHVYYHYGQFEGYVFFNIDS